MTEKMVSDALHVWDHTLAKIDAAKDALYDFLNEMTGKEPGIQGVFCIAYTLELVGEEGRRAFDIVNKAKADQPSA